MTAREFYLFFLILLSAALLYASIFFNKKAANKKRNAIMQEDEEKDKRKKDGGCGLSTICNMDCGIEEKKTDPVYYEDEELDIFAGKNKASYSTKETALFEEVLITLKASEIHGWLLSLRQRNISLPKDLREKVLERIQSDQKSIP